MRPKAALFNRLLGHNEGAHPQPVCTRPPTSECPLGLWRSRAPEQWETFGNIPKSCNSTSALRKSWDPRQFSRLAYDRP